MGARPVKRLLERVVMTSLSRLVGPCNAHVLAFVAWVQAPSYVTSGAVFLPELKFMSQSQVNLCSNAFD